MMFDLHPYFSASVTMSKRAELFNFNFTLNSLLALITGDKRALNWTPNGIPYIY